MYPRFATRPQGPITYFLRKYIKQYIYMIRCKHKLTTPAKRAKLAALTASNLLDNKPNITTVAVTVSTADNMKLLQCPGPANDSAQEVHFPCYFLLSWLIQEPQSAKLAPAMVEDDQSLSSSPGDDDNLDKDSNSDSSCEASSTQTATARPSLCDLLAAARPSLLHILPAMIDIGFKSDDVLEEVLSWSAPRLMAAVEKWYSAGFLPISVIEAQALTSEFLMRKTG
jgi:hypothetical protein